MASLVTRWVAFDVMKSGYRPDIDGLRAVAVLAVLAFHAFPSLVPSGFVGVDEFFVISGYLITGLLLKDFAEQGALDLVGFYRRRVRRIFPALLLVLAAASALGWVLMTPAEYATLGRHVAAGSVFLSNFALWSQAGYFGAAANTTPLLHLWSLAVEEQFYLLWPLVLIVGYRFQRVGLAITAVAIASFAANVEMRINDPVGVFFLPFGRFWELALGAVLCLTPILSGWQAVLASCAGGALVATSLAWSIEPAAYPGFIAIVPTVGTALLIAAGPTAAFNRLLALRIPVAIGRISYPLYLWHWPLLAFAALCTAGPGVRAGCLAFSFILAACTYAWMERPIRASNSPWVLAALLTSMAALGAVGWLIERETIGVRNNNSRVEAFTRASNDWAFPSRFSHREHMGSLEVWSTGPSGAPATLVIGDSFAEQYMPRVDALVQHGLHRRFIFATLGGCPPLAGMGSLKNPYCRDFGDRLEALALRGEGFDSVVFSASLLGYLTDGANAYVDENGRIPLSDPRGPPLLLSRFDSFMKQLHERGRRLAVILPNPVSESFRPELLVRRSLTGFQVLDKPVKLDQIASVHTEYLKYFLASSRRWADIVISPQDVVCPNRECQVIADGLPIYKDAAHFTARYVRTHGAFVDRAFLSE